jgi:hypothetical protein
MIAAGALAASRVGRVWVIEPEEVAAVEASARRSGRPYSARMVWAVLRLLGGDDPGGPPHVRSRARRALREAGPVAVVDHGRPRGEVVRWRVLPAHLGQIESVVVRTGLSAWREAGFDVAPTGELAGYLDAAGLEVLRDRFRPFEDPERPNLWLCVPTDPWVLERPDQAVPPVVAAADLLGSTDPRVRRTGVTHLTDAWNRWSDG